MNNTLQVLPEIVAPVESTESVLNILIVDDNENDLMCMETMLKHEHRNIYRAKNGTEALQLIKEKELAIILLDVQLPDVSGIEIARQLKENPATSDISIIFVTAMNAGAMQCYEQGAVDYLHKPLDINVTRAKVQVFEKLYRQRIELQSYVKQVEQINKQLDEFVYIVSHDLKAPLRGLASLTSFLEEELGKEIKPEAKELIDMVKNRTNRMQVLIDAILHYSRVANKKTEKEEIKTNELLNSIIDLLEVPSHIRFEIQSNLPDLFAEKIKLYEVFQNLITNAIKYNNKSEGYIRITCEDHGSHYQFNVADNGMGIEEQHFNKIFGVFQTLQSKDKSESTGIGLTIVKKIVEQQDGRVLLESTFGEGTTFSFIWNK